MNRSDYKPNLIPNNKKDGSTDLRAIIEGNGGVQNYYVTVKKDGCRLALGVQDTCITRGMKVPKSEEVVKRFQRLNDIAKKENVILDGEFYSHGMKFNAVVRFFTKTGVESEEYKNSLIKEHKKNPEAFKDKYDELSIEFLTTFHKSLHFWWFDGVVLDRPDLVGFEERMAEIKKRLEKYELSYKDYFTYPVLMDFVKDCEELERMYNNALNLGWEGLVLTHKDHQYKMEEIHIKRELY